MRLNAAPLALGPPKYPFLPQLTKCPFFSNPHKSGKLLKCKILKKKRFPKLHSMQRSSGAANFDREGLGDAEESKEFCAVPSRIIRLHTCNSFLQSSVDILDPIAIGIRPEPPSWLERESILWTRLEQTAKSFDLPVSIRMIQKKIKLRRGLKVLEESASCSVRKALSTMVFIVIELQSSALKMREALCNEDLEMIINNVQSDIQSSYAWLFQQVLSRTPALMIYVIILLANFSLHSTSLNVAVAQASLVCDTTMEMDSIQHSSADNSSITISANNASGGKEDKLIAGGSWNDFSKSRPYANISPREFLQDSIPGLRSMAELILWNSMVVKATEMQADQSDIFLDRELLLKFVSPISAVVVETDDYLEYSKTDVRYQIALSQDPNNPLLLCNYAKFLSFVLQDPDRAEECFKKAVQVEPPDAESNVLYADFLWKVRNDLWAAEQRYLEALAVEPDNTYHASKYAEFLWRTGGEDTCFPINFK